jgi:hypothetical protein
MTKLQYALLFAVFGALIALGSLAIMRFPAIP